MSELAVTKRQEAKLGKDKNERKISYADILNEVVVAGLRIPSSTRFPL